MSSLKKIIKIIWVISTLSIIIFVFGFYSIKIDLFRLFGGMPSLQDLEKPQSESSSELYSNDTILLGKYFRYNRSPIKYHELSNELITTLLVTEDIRFYNHSGIDFKGLVRATYGVFKNMITLGSSGLEGGGSTITQQLAKNLFKIIL